MQDCSQPKPMIEQHATKLVTLHPYVPTLRSRASLCSPAGHASPKNPELATRAQLLNVREPPHLCSPTTIALLLRQRHLTGSCMIVLRHW
eukprot:scaffold280197_cov43-Tisochrysis_lutea.AAC.1